MLPACCERRRDLIPLLFFFPTIPVSLGEGRFFLGPLFLSVGAADDVLMRVTCYLTCMFPWGLGVDFLVLEGKWGLGLASLGPDSPTL
jgi:hypothetical protein